MPEYIDREAAIDYIKQNQCKKCSDIGLCGNCAVLTGVRLFEEVPAADVAPVVHGQWIDKPTGRYGQMQSWCSACGKHSGIGGIKSNRHKPYCPNCGAKMDGGEGK